MNYIKSSAKLIFGGGNIAFLFEVLDLPVSRRWPLFFVQQQMFLSVGGGGAGGLSLSPGWALIVCCRPDWRAKMQ